MRGGQLGAVVCDTRPWQVGFIFYYDGRTRLYLARRFFVFFGSGLRFVYHYQDQIGVRQGFHRFLDADAFGLVEGAADRAVSTSSTGIPPIGF